MFPLSQVYLTFWTKETVFAWTSLEVVYLKQVGGQWTNLSNKKGLLILTNARLLTVWNIKSTRPLGKNCQWIAGGSAIAFLFGMFTPMSGCLYYAAVQNSDDIEFLARITCNLMMPPWFVRDEKNTGTCLVISVNMPHVKIWFQCHLNIKRV